MEKTTEGGKAAIKLLMSLDNGRQQKKPSVAGISPCGRRLMKELKEINVRPVEGISLISDSADGPPVPGTFPVSMWLVRLQGPTGSLYENESFTLRFEFGSGYPIDSPVVYFLKPVPIHEHIYSNGHICLSILYDEWSPAMTVESVCLSIISMLASATLKVKPPSDNSYSQRVGNKNPKDTDWNFHDDKC